MSDDYTPNLNLPTLPQNSRQLSSVYNPAMQILDIVAQAGLEGALDTPPATTEADIGKSWLVVATATGAWAGHEDEVAYCTGENLWGFLEPAIGIKFFLRKDNGGFYKWDSGWVLAAGLGDAPSDGSGYVRKDGAWVAEAGFTDAPSDGYSYSRQDGAWERTRAYLTITEKTADAVLALTDGDWIDMNVASANTLTVPPEVDEDFHVGTMITVQQVGMGQTTIVPGAGVTIVSDETMKLRKQNAVATLVKRGADLWTLTGSLEAAP